MREVCVISNLSSADQLNSVRRRSMGTSVLACEDGGMTMVVSGKKIFLGSSQVVVIPYDKEVSAVKLSSSARVSALVVSNLYMLRFIPAFGSTVLGIYRELSLKPVRVSTCGVLCSLIQCIDEWAASGMGDATFIDSTICSMVSALTSDIDQSDIDVGFDCILMAKFLKLVRTEICRHHDVAWYSHQLGVSSKLLSKEIKTAFSNEAHV